MNTSQLKDYVPKARRDFIDAVSSRQAARYGITEDHIDPVEDTGELLIINGKQFPRELATSCKKLIKRIQQQGFTQLIEAIAYTWFNRIAAIRFMELHKYLDHSFRVLIGGLIWCQLAS